MDTSTLDLDKMKTSAGKACQRMKVLSNPDRLMLLCQLSQSEKRVGELEEILGIVQPTLSQQLTVLREEELVTTRRDGKSIYYKLASPQALAVMNVLFEQFCGPKTGCISPHGRHSLAASFWGWPRPSSFCSTAGFWASAASWAASCPPRWATPGGALLFCWACLQRPRCFTLSCRLSG